MFEFDIEKFNEAFGIPKNEEEKDLPLSPFEYLMTKWIRVNGVSKGLFGMCYSDMQVANKEDVTKALRIAYNCGLNKRSIHEVSKEKEGEMIL